MSPLHRAPTLASTGRDLAAEPVVVVGGGGRVGFGLCLVLAEAGYTVTGLDIDAERVATINRGEVPFLEEGAGPALARALASARFSMSTDPGVVEGARYVVMIPGTPLDEEQSPDLRPLMAAVQEVSPHLRSGTLLVLRSTVGPGVTRVVADRVAAEAGLRLGEELDVVFAPERVVEGAALRESRTIPQIVGAFSERGFERAERFFAAFNPHPIIRVTPTEAELAKLMCNMYRYAQFALANEFYLLAEGFGADAHRVIDACNHGYERVNIPSPGPNVGGPCLAKDGWFLNEAVPFADLFSVAYRVNEGMPMQIVRRLEQRCVLGRVGILGLTFKADCDDTRRSLSGKLSRQLERRGVEVVAVDPYVDSDPTSALAGVDAVVLMTPHRMFRDVHAVAGWIGNPDCVFCDVWGHWSRQVPTARSGFFIGADIPVSTEETRDLSRVPGSTAPLLDVSASRVAPGGVSESPPMERAG